MSARSPRLEISVDEDGEPYYAELHLPPDSEDGRTITAISKRGGATTIQFGIEAKVIVTHRLRDWLTDHPDLEEHDRSLLPAFWAGVDELLPEAERPVSWLPVYIRSQDGRGNEHPDYFTVSAQDYRTFLEAFPRATIWDAPKLFNWDSEAEHPPVSVVPDTVPPDRRWLLETLDKALRCAYTQADYEAGRLVTDVDNGTLAKAYLVKKKCEEEQAEDEAEAMQSQSDDEAKRRAEAEADEEWEHEHRDDGHEEES